MVDTTAPPVFFGVQMERDNIGEWHQVDKHVRAGLSQALTLEDVAALTTRACP